MRGADTSHHGYITRRFLTVERVIIWRILGSSILDDNECLAEVKSILKLHKMKNTQYRLATLNNKECQ